MKIMKDTVRLEFYLYSMRRFMWSYCCLAEPTNFCRNAPRVAILWCIFFADCRSEVGGVGQNSCRAKCACKARPTPSTRFCYHSSLHRLCGLRHAKHAPQCHTHLVRKKHLGALRGLMLMVRQLGIPSWDQVASSEESFGEFNKFSSGRVPLK